METLPGLLRQPLVHFLVLGALLFVVDGGLSGGTQEEMEEVIITAAQAERLRQAWQRDNGRRPTAAEEQLILDQLVGEELLHQEAMRRRLYENDLVVSRRLLDKMSFLNDDPEKTAPELYREAFELGLHREDPIVRSRLIHKLRMLTAAEVGALRFDEAEIRDYYERHREEFLEPGRVRLSHVFLSREQRSDRIEVEAAALLERLRQEGLEPAAAVAEGDAFLLGHHLPAQTTGQLERFFGAPFARSVAELPVEAWSGPVESAYGLHLVWVHERMAPRPAELDAVRQRIYEALRVEHREARVADLVDRLRRRYPVRFEGVEFGGQG